MNRKLPKTDIDPRVKALPPDGQREYLRWCETFQRLFNSYLTAVEELKKTRKLDPTHAVLYDWKIESMLREASERMEEWEGHRLRILDKWLPED